MVSCSALPIRAALKAWGLFIHIIWLRIHMPSGIILPMLPVMFMYNSKLYGTTNAVTSKALPSTAGVTAWGLDYVYTAQTNSFSSFYFASKIYTALPIDLEYFKGSVEAVGNRLQWKADCTANADFIIERSADGVQFSQVGLVWATSADCAHPFQFVDKDPLQGKQYYRLQLKEANAQPVYSHIVTLERKGGVLKIQLTGNPVTGNSAGFAIYSPANMLLPVTVYDVTGKAMLATQFSL